MYVITYSDKNGNVYQFRSSKSTLYRAVEEWKQRRGGFQFVGWRKE